MPASVTWHVVCLTAGVPNQGGLVVTNGFGPHGIISTGEIIASLVALFLGLTAMSWMAFRTRRHH